jgi:hypothetical protein
MGELLHGPWQLTATKSSGVVRESVVIAGSNSSDGRHEVLSGTPVHLNLNGGEWEVSLQVFLSNGWTDIERLSRKTQIVPGQGLTVSISGELLGLLTSLKVILVSRDPILNPPQQPPPDLSLPGNSAAPRD